jgi:hypothetical protein
MDTKLFANMDKPIWGNMTWEDFSLDMDFELDLDFDLGLDTNPWFDDTTITDGSTTAEPDPRG